MSDITKNERDYNVIENSNLYGFSRELILNSCKFVYQTANFAMVETYWHIGRKIVEEQGGTERAKYGNELIEDLSKRLTAEFGKGFTVRNLRAMRQFYLQSPIEHALRAQLNWTHYCSLIRAENSKAREVYMNVTAKDA